MTLVALVVAAAALLQTWVSVTGRFEGRLWTLPSRIYSDALRVAPGVPLSISQLVERLERCGYARTEGTPGSPGQFRVEADRLDLRARPFRVPTGTIEQLDLTIRFAAREVRSVRDAEGRRLREALLEPELLATLYGARQEERFPLTLAEIPEGFVAAVLAAEDARFYTHHGIDLRGILRAALANLRSLGVVQGGSTITQQTAKNLFLDQRRTWWRKLRESVMSVMLDANYPKQRILEVYLNEVYLGQRGSVAICGVQAAARFYFGRDLADLGLAEWALLAGLISNPGGNNPFRHPDRSVARRDRVLDAMARLELASEAAVESARRQPLVLGSGSGGFRRAAYAVDYVRNRLVERYPSRVLQGEGLEIHTSIDTTVQEQAEEALQSGLARLERDVPAVRRQVDERGLQGMVLVTRPEDGAILAMVGGRDHATSQFNRAVQARRQPGSCFKPFVYAAGFELYSRRDPNGLTPATTLPDRPFEVVSGGKVWRPANYDREYRDRVTVRQALEDSLNIPTVHAARHVGLERVIDTARRCGIRSPMSPIPSLALGTEEVTGVELAEAYGTLARLGSRSESWVIQAITDRDGTILERHEGQAVQALGSQAAYLVNDLLRGVMRRGTGKSARLLGYRGGAAGKTGTTDDTRDSWFVGYTSEMLALVWVGYDDNASTGLTGASGALPIWVDLMERTGRSERPESGVTPTDVVTVTVDPETGLRAVKGCPTRVEQTFLRGTQPRQRCHSHEGKFRRWFRKLVGKEHEESI